MADNTSAITSPGSNMTVDDLSKALSGLASGNMATASPGKYGRPADTSLIYLGKQPSKGSETSKQRALGKAEGGYAPSPMVAPSNVKRPYSEVRLDPTRWSENELVKFVNQGVMNKVPGFDVNMGMPEILSAWDDMIKSAFAMNSADPNNPRWTPQDVMNTYSNPKGRFGTVRKGDWEYDIATGEKIKYVGPLSKTSTATQINQLTREDALALTKNSMAQMLGRNPSQAEIARYLGILNGYESEHPQVTTTTQNINPETGESESSSSVTTGGTTAAGRQALLEEQMQKSPEYGAYQAATTGMSWLMQAISKGAF